MQHQHARQGGGDIGPDYHRGTDRRRQVSPLAPPDQRERASGDQAEHQPWAGGLRSDAAAVVIVVGGGGCGGGRRIREAVRGAECL